MEYAIGIDLGGTNIKFAAVSKDGNIIHQELCETQDDKSSILPWAQKISTTIQSIENNFGPATWIGVSAPGMPDKENKAIISLPGRLNGLEGLNWTDFLKRDSFVPVINDAHAALHGELWQGSAKNYQNVIFLTLGTGVGGAFSIKGELISGTLGRAGHFGHTCLNPDLPSDIKNTPGSIENMIGECSVRRRSGGRFLSTEKLVNAHLSGDEQASRVWLRSVYHLACAITSFINIIDPQVVLLGGGISKAGHALMQPLEKYMDKVEWRPEGHKVKIKFAQLGNQAGSLGAARYAIFQAESQQSSCVA